MTQRQPGAGRLRYWPRLLFAIPFAAILWVPSYNRMEPALGGIPFFYWYQLAWILLGAAIVLIAYLLETRITGATARSKAGPETDGTPGDVL
jgi:hypothetical protein